MSELALPAGKQNAVATNLPATHSRGRAFLARAVREPLLHFVVLGAVLYFVSTWLTTHPEAQRIVVSRADIDGIATNYQLQYGARPSGQQLDALVDAFVREEIYYREALRNGLDRNDEIVRRRLVQKYEFLQQDLAAVPEPDEATLTAWFEQHRSQYQQPARVSFTQVYFSPDARGEQGARESAVRERARLVASGRVRAPEDGDLFPGTTDFSALTAQDIGRVFGDGTLSEQIFSLPASTWSAPLRSGLGWHLVRVDGVEPAQVPAYADVAARVRGDWLDAQRGQRNEDDYARLRAGYTIVRQ
jgi:peptidyl-prolyl cis-trans isomerase C